MLDTLYYKASTRAGIVNLPAWFSGFAFGVCKVELLMSIRVMVVSKTVLFGLPKLEGTTSLDMIMFIFVFSRSPEEGMYNPRKASFEQSEQDAQVLNGMHALTGLLGSKRAVHVESNDKNTEKTEDIIAYRHRTSV